MGTPPIFCFAPPRNATGHGRGRGLKDTSISLCGLPLFFVGTLLVAPKLPAMLRDTAGGGVRHLCSIVVSASPLLRTVSPIFCFAPPRHAAGHGRDGVLRHPFIM